MQYITTLSNSIIIQIPDISSDSSVGDDHLLQQPPIISNE